MFGWDADGGVTFEGEIRCIGNEAILRGGCLHGEGRVTLASGTVMRGNVAEFGGCLCERDYYLLFRLLFMHVPILI